MFRRDKKDRSLLSIYKAYIIIPEIFIGVIVAASITLIIIYGFTNLRGYLIALVILAILALVSYNFIAYFFFKQLRVVFFDQLFEVTYDNMERLKKNNIQLLSYNKELDIKEIKMLDEATRLLKERLGSSYLMSVEPNYSTISLEYVDESRNLVTYTSFKKNLSNVIFLSQSFRNVLIEVYFSLPRSYVMQEKEKDRILNLYFNAFKAYKKTLFMFRKDDKGLIIYLPVIDSFSEIREILETVVVDSSIMIRDERGIRNVPAQYALVAYPYSTEEMLLGDLKYARRQNKPYFLFLPKRYKDSSSGQELLSNSTMNLNYMSKMMLELSQLDYSSQDNDENIHILNSLCNSFSTFLGIDEVGVIAYDNSTEKYYSYASNSKGNIFIESVPNKLIETLAKNVDEDQSYYFSTRSHANREIAREIDLYGISSGIYYAIQGLENSNLTALVYAFNIGKDLNINSYIRESFYMMGVRIENYFEKKEIADYADALDEENENLLAISDHYSYRIDEDFKIVKMSRNVKLLAPKAKVGSICYKAFLGADKPCFNCPLKTYKRKVVSIYGVKYEASTVLNNRKSLVKNVLLRKIDNEIETDFFQKNLLIYSYNSLFTTMKNNYISSARGYLVLLSIDNYEKLVDQKGGEAYELSVRNFIRNIKNKLKTDEIYYYNPTTIAVHFPYVGHADVINKIEAIYPLSKEDVSDDDYDDSLDVTYLAAGYPRGYATAEDFMKHVSDFYHSDYEKNKDFIYFSDYSISRSASKRDFMISVLESEFGSHNSTSMNLQPIVRVKDGHIFGAEILLRIADEHRNVYFNANEISALAQQEKKTQLITESIINFVGNMYKEYGENIFKINKFNRIAINIDETYLDDASLVKEMVNLCKTNHLPNEFVSLEIPEDMIPHNIEGIKSLARELRSYNILFSCDRYMGEYIDIEQLKELGFNEVKVARDIIMKIDTDPVRLQELTDIVNAAKQFEMRVAAVGVENEKQYQILKDLDEEAMVQGYYLYRPLSRSDLISALISYEK